jgi:hypothetical protein
MIRASNREGLEQSIKGCIEMSVSSTLWMIENNFNSINWKNNTFVGKQ